jgi:hypothetical protein
MAINPNTDFSSGAVLTAAQQNRFPRGVMAYAEVTSTGTATGTESVQITATTFSAVANRYYKLSYYEPQCYSGGAGMWELGIRLTNAAGTQYQRGFGRNIANEGIAILSQTIETFSAGNIVIVGTLKFSGGTGNPIRSATQPAFILVEDIGPS